MISSVARFNPPNTRLGGTPTGPKHSRISYVSRQSVLEFLSRSEQHRAPLPLELEGLPYRTGYGLLASAPPGLFHPLQCRYSRSILAELEIWNLLPFRTTAPGSETERREQSRCSLVAYMLSADVPLSNSGRHPQARAGRTPLGYATC